MSRSSILDPIKTIAGAELLGTSLWFSANGVSADLMREWHLQLGDIGTLTTAVQLGFIAGTLSFALTALADRVSASRLFGVCALLGALANALFALMPIGWGVALLLRFLVGFSMAGVYPIGMKLVVSWAPELAAEALAQLVGMLTLGSALPHILRALGADWPWQPVLLSSSLLALIGAAMIVKLGDGPNLRLRATAATGFGQVLEAFREPRFRASALGYFGHMWELYGFWTLAPWLVAHSALGSSSGPTQISIWSFAVMAVGVAGCVLGGRLARQLGSARVAAWALAGSGICAALFGLGADLLSPGMVAGLLLVWGTCVVADSPHFSALSARSCPAHLIGSALALQNAIGFLLSVLAIALVTHSTGQWGLMVTLLLVPGPVLGLIAFWPLARQSTPAT